MTKHQIHAEISKHLERISKFMGPKYRLTLVARYTKDDLKDADLVIGDDDLIKSQETLERMRVRPPTIEKTEQVEIIQEG